jgi:DNA-binding transcriptional LysR family regulator
MTAGPPQVDLTSLRWSMAVAKAGGFRRAAEALGVEQSALSRRVRRLEEDLGVSLFQRSVRGTAPTNAGAVFIRRVEGLFEGLASAISDARAAGRGQTGHLRIGLSFSLRSMGLLSLIDRFHGAHPRVRIEMSEGSAGAHLDAVADQRLDVAILPGGMRVTGLDISVLWEEDLLVALPSDHPKAASSSIRLADIAKTRLLISERDIGRGPFASLVQTTGLDVEVLDAGAALLLEQTRMGFGLTLLGAGALAQIRPGLGLVFRPLAQDGQRRLSVAAAWSASNDNPALRRFMSAARLAGRTGASPAARPSIS